MTGPRVEKLVLVAPNPAGSPVPAEVLEYLIEDDDAVVDELAAAAESDATVVADCALVLLGDEATDKTLHDERGVGIMREFWCCRKGQMRLAVLLIITEEFMVMF